MALAPTPSPVIEFPRPDASLAYQPVGEGALVIASDTQYAAAADHLKTIKAFQRRVTDWFAPLKRKAQDAHRALCEEERKILTPAADDERRIKAAIGAYTEQQERARREEETRLREEARQREETARLAEAAALEREAQATGDATLQAAAEALIEAPIAVAPVQAVTPPAPKVEGVSYREVYRAEVTDLMTLVKAVAAGQQPLTLLEANQSALDGLARALRTAYAVPGTRLIAERTVVARGR